MTVKSLVACAGRALAAAAIVVPTAARADVEPHAGMLRYPDVGRTHIVFIYAGDIWLVPRAGGPATRLAAAPGQELFPKFSPDDKTVAFVGNYDGNRDLYTIPTDGGTATRVTYHPGPETLWGWTPDGKSLIYSTVGTAGLTRQAQLFTIPATGGMPTRMPVPYGANASISDDGNWLAYTPHSTDLRTWKRYRGGMATDVWLFNLKDHSSKRITDWEGTDTDPMWNGDKVYYLSDQGTGETGYEGDHRLNIWVYDTKSSQRKQVTHFKDFDVKWPSVGPGPDGKGEIVFQCGPSLYLLSLAADNAEPRAVTVTIPGDRPLIRTRNVDADKFITDWTLSPSGKRVAVGARGDIWSLPAEKGTPRNLTRTSGVAERSPSWSPDGRWIAYFTDATGEYELNITQSDGLGKTVALTKAGSAPEKFRFNPVWSPDSKLIAFTDKTGTLYLTTLGEPDGQGGFKESSTKKLDADPWGSPINAAWSSDSKWLTYTKQQDGTNYNAVWLCNVDTGKTERVTSGMFTDGSPVFDRKGDWLFFTSARHFAPVYSDIDNSFIYNGSQEIIGIPLRADLDSPWAPKSDEEDWSKAGKKEDKKDDEKGEKKDEKKDESKPDKKDDGGGNGGGDTYKPSKKGEKDADEKKDDGDKAKEKPKKPLTIDLEGMENRALVIPVPSGSFGRVAVNDKDQLIYVRMPVDGRRNGGASEAEIKLFDLTDDKKEEKTVAKGSDFEISADGKHLLVKKGKESAIQDAAPDSKAKTVVTSPMIASINPREEWKQIFNDAWRIERDFFYVSNMHGVDWNALRAQYGKMLDDAASRDDLSFIISELISELNIGHAYYSGGDIETGPSVSCGMLGCDYELAPASGATPAAYRIKKIFRGAPWDTDAKGPLSQPGINVKEGDYLLAVNGIPLDTSKDPWAAFQGLGGKVITITVNDSPSLDRPAEPKKPEPDKKDEKKDDEKPKKPTTGLRDVVVQCVGSETDLRYRDYIESKRAYVAKKTDGRIGYIYVPSTGLDGQSDLFRQFYGQIDKAGLIIDERWNSGGQIPTRFIELLNRPVTNYWARREGHEGAWPPDAHQGPKCMLINGLAGSGGDMFPWLFKHDKLGKLIGMRTWGGLVGISGTPGLIDGANVTAPDFGFYKTDGTWGVEGHGVDPDIVVIDDPAKMADGGDPQLDAAIDHITGEVKAHPYTPPKRPADPDRKGMGIRPEDR
jgi:tricorn protease